MDNSTRDRFQTAVTILEALMDGKAVQYKTLGEEWMDYLPDVPDATPAVLSIHYKWRIKPEPRVIYVSEYVGGLADRVFHDRKMAEAYASSPSHRGIRKFIEVIE